MERRDFLKGLVASGALGATSLPAGAAILAARSDPASSILIVCQDELPQAVALGAAMASALRKAGREDVTLIRCGGSDLSRVAAIDALLTSVRDGQIVGVMDDAAAVLFHEVAAARGAGYLMQAQHRFTSGAVRHRLTRSGLAGAIAWANAGAGWEAPIARLYADVLVGRVPALLPRQSVAAGGGPAQAGLVSFALNIQP